MKYVKMLGLLAVGAAALMVFAGAASATVTSGGTTISTVTTTSTNSELDGTVDIKCKHSHMHSHTVTSGATTAAVSTLSFTECGADTVSVINKGSLRIDSNGTVYSEGAEVTVQVHRTVLGFPVTTHCIYKTAANPGTDVGTLTEGTTTINLIGTNIPQVSTDGGCGSNAQWTGTYTVVSPGAITVH